MSVALTLGEVVFEDFEIPPSIRGGGSQQIDLKKYLGGARKADAMGPDDDPIAWTGRFRGITAEGRCQYLNTLRKAGDPLPLTWSSFRYTVLIDKFTFDYDSQFEIPYQISLLVVSDDTAPITVPPAGIDEVFGSDYSNVSDLGDSLGVDFPAISAALSDLAVTVGTIQTISGSSSQTFLALNQNIAAAQGATQAAIVVASGQVTPVAGAVFGGIAGLPPETIAANVSGQSGAFLQLGALYPLGDTLTRMSKNLATVGP